MSIEKEVAFDPYHKWLGIPKAQRPPTHYQILGLAQGETDAEVIEEAAIRQTTHLRAYQVGPHADDCTKLLNEVSAARQILVNPQKRQDYDSKLAQFAAKQAAAQPGNGAAKPAVAAPIVESAFADLSDGDDVPAGGSRRDLAKSARPHKPAKRPAPKAEPIGFSQTMILAAAGGVGLLIVGLVAIVAFFVSPPPPPPIPAPMANNNPKVAPPVVVNPQPNVPGVDPKLLVNPVPNPKDPLAGVTGFPPLGAFTLRSTPKNLIALADGRVFFGESNLNAYDPGSSRGLPFLSFPNPGPRGIRFALTPDGKQVCIGTPDAGKLVLHKLYGAQIASLKSPGEISAMAISPDGTTLVTGLFNGHVRIWDMATLVGVDMPQFHGPRSVESVVFSRDGSLVATASEKLILIWSARDKKLVVGVGIGQVPTSMAFTPDGKKLLAASAAGLQSTPLNNPRWTPVKPGRDGILHVAFVNDTTLAALRPEGPELYEWPTMTLLRQTLVGTRDCDTMALSPDGKVLFVGLTVPRLLAFGTEIDAVLKPYVSGTQKQGPPPTGSGAYVGLWHFPNNPNGLVKIDVTVKSVGGVLSALLELRRSSLPVAKAHVDALKTVNGKMRGIVFPDTAVPVPWTDLNELVLDAPINNTMRIELRGTRSHFYSLQRQAGGVVVDEPPPPKVPVTPKTDPIPVVRAKVPTAEKIAEVTAAVHENFKKEYAKKSPTDRAELAESLLKLAIESKNDPADRYVLCCEARDLAAAAGKWSIVADAFEQLESGFVVDLLPQKEAALQLLMKSGLNKESATEATEAALQGVSDAIAADQLPLAGNFLALANTASAKSLNVPHISLVKKADAEFKLVNQEADTVKKARETLKTMPDDPAANLAVGRYEALRQGNWKLAMPLLAKSGDSELMSVARKELDAPKDGAAQQKAAEEWWALAEKEKASTWIRAALQSRAAHWYRLAASQVTGLSLTLIHERLKTIEDAPSPFRIGGATAELKVLRGHKGAVTSLHLTLDGKVLFSGSLDATVKRWDLKTGKNLTTFPAGQPIHALAFSPSGRFLAIGFKDTVKIVDSEDKIKGRLPSNGWPGSTFIDESTLYSLYTGGFSTTNVTFGSSGSGPHVMRGSGWVRSPSNQWLIVYGEESWLCQTFPSGGLGPRYKLSFVDSTVTSTIAAFSPTQQSAAIATSDKKIHLLDIQTRNETATLEGASGVARCLAYLPTGDRLLSGGDDGVVHLWDVSTGKEVRHFSTGSKAVTSILVTPDSKQIITGGSDGVIRVWAMPRERLTTKTASLETPNGRPQMQDSPVSANVGPPEALPGSRTQRKLRAIGFNKPCEVTVLYPVAKRVTVDVRTIERSLDVDLFIRDASNTLVAGDSSVGPDSHVTFNAQAGRSYRFKIMNRSAGTATSTVIYTTP